MFERDKRLQFTEIVSYKADKDIKWFALTGLEPVVSALLGWLATLLFHHQMWKTYLRYRRSKTVPLGRKVNLVLLNIFGVAAEVSVANRLTNVLS